MASIGGVLVVPPKHALLIRSGVVLLTLLAVLTLAGCAAVPSRSNRVLIFGLDGGSWNILLPMIEAGELPALGGVYGRSIRGELLAQMPMQSPILWSTIFTSKLPEEHGVRHWDSALDRNRLVKTVWRIAEETGRVSRVLNVPSTWPARTLRGTTVAGMPVPRSTPINGTGSILHLVDGSLAPKAAPLIVANVPSLRAIGSALEVNEWSPWIELPEVVDPSVGGRVKLMKLTTKRVWVSPLYRFGPKLLISDPAEFIADLESATGRPYIPEGPGFRLWREPSTARYVYPHLFDLTSMHLAAAMALRDTPWDLFIYVNTFVDRISHLYWPYLFPNDYEGVAPAATARFEGRVHDAYREADRQLGELLAAVDEETYVVVLSDHGFRSAVDPRERIGLHRLEGIYMIAGPGIEPSDGPLQNNVDAGSTILHLLGIPPARDMTGKVFSAVAEQLGPPAEGPETYEKESFRSVLKGIFKGDSAAAEDPADLEEDQRQALEQVRSLGYLALDETTPPEESDQPASERVKVCVDAGHNTRHGIAGAFAGFAKLLAGNGFEVAGISTALLPAALTECDVLTIANPMNARVATGDWSAPFEPAFTRDEIVGLIDWVRQGGSLFLIVDHAPIPAVARDLMELLGAVPLNGFTFDNDPGDFDWETGKKTFRKSPTVFRRDDGTLVSHAIVEGRRPEEAVHQVVTFGGHAFFPSLEIEPILMFGEGNSGLTAYGHTFDEAPGKRWPRFAIGGWLQAGARRLGAGRVVILGEAAACTALRNRDSGLGSPRAPENPQFCLNIVRWLAREIEPDKSGTSTD